MNESTHRLYTYAHTHTHTHTHTHIYMRERGARGLMVDILKDEHVNPSSQPGQGCLHFSHCLNTLVGKVGIQLFSPAMSK